MYNPLTILLTANFSVRINPNTSSITACFTEDPQKTWILPRRVLGFFVRNLQKSKLISVILFLSHCQCPRIKPANGRNTLGQLFSPAKRNIKCS